MQSKNLQEPLFPVFTWEHGVVEIFRGPFFNQYVFEVMKYLSDFSSTWWLILIPVLALVKRYGPKVGVSFIGLTGIAVLVCDMISYRLIKAMVVRQRPDFYGDICVASECWGFVSSHASNTFCAATILTGYLGRKWAIPLYSLATLISFSRVYLGKHYPLDVIGGALLGVLVGAGALALVDRLKERWGKKMSRTRSPEKKAFARHTFFVAVFTAIFCLFSIFYSDQAVAQAFDDPSLAAFRQFCSDITDIGLGAFYFVLSLFVYLSSLWIFPRLQWFRRRAELLQKFRFASGFSFASLFLIGLVNLILKVSFGRARPHMTETFESLKFDPLNFHWYWHSFPSGHAQVVFVVATLMSIAWPRFKLFFLFSALGIALTRVVIHQHFLSDIVLGATIGYLGTVGLFIYQKEKSKIVFEGDLR